MEDLGSTNGTFVNDKRRFGETLLKDGDSIRIGNCIFRFLAGDQVEADYRAEIARLSVFDPLTGAYNRRAFDQFLKLEWIGRSGIPLSLLSIDMDQFASVNDRFGFAAGDQVLRGVADLIRLVIRPDDMLTRSKGAGFALVLVETPLDVAVVFGERIRQAVSKSAFKHGSDSMNVTASVGVAVARPGGPVEVDALIRQAEARLAEAKRNGRNRVCPG